MSNTAPQFNVRLPRVARAAVERARLTVVPRRRTRAARVPFVTLVSAILLGGVVGLLLFNTGMQQASFEAAALQRQATDLGARQEALEMEIQTLRDPDRIARAAQRQGLVIPTTTGVLDLGSGKVRGSALPANGPRLPLGPPAAKLPAELRQPRARVQSPKTTNASKAKNTPKVRTRKQNRDGAPTLR